MTNRILFDIETNGLLQDVTKVHCISMVYVDDSRSRFFNGSQINEFLELLNTLTDLEIIGHNIVHYDLPVLKKLYGFVPKKDVKISDTLILTQLLYPDIYNDDEGNIFEGQVFTYKEKGSHSLKAWGQRLKCYKGDYSGGWEEYNDDMGRYCIQDTFTNKALFSFLESKFLDKLTSLKPIELEHSIAPILSRQQNFGILFNQTKAEGLTSLLMTKLFECRSNLQNLFKPRYVSEGEFTPKRNDKSKGYSEGHTFTKISLEEFNPGSRQQIVSRLKEKFGWDPTEFTEKGNAKMDDQIIENLPFKELAPLKEYLTIKKRLGQISEGNQAWLKKVDRDGRIRGGIRQNGAITGRMAHFSPNLAQVPSNDSLFGKECRELFIVPEDKVMIGCDADSLEMRCLGGYLKRFDNGRFTQSLLHGNKEDKTDPHSINAEAMGIDRETGKTVFYAWVYGARNAKIGKILLEAGIDFNEYVENFEKNVEGMIKWAEEKGIERTEQYWRCWIAGKECIARFGDRIPELQMLKDEIHRIVKERGYIKGLDGRKLFCRSEHGELNTVLQSAGAIIMKKALYIADTDMREKGLIEGCDYEFLLNVHDEWELEVKNAEITIDIVKEIVQYSIYKAGESFNFPCPMSGNVKIGKNWAEVH